jgi:hypothetical protein
MFDGEASGGPVGWVGSMEAAGSTETAACGWREIDRQLRRVARARARVDADELVWLARADEAKVHVRLGCVSMLEYIERVLGHPPRAARERLRVARALTALPGLAAELASGRQSFSAVRELTRVARPETEAAWIAAATGRCVREVEELVAGREPGADPGDPPAPDRVERPFELMLTSAARAMFRLAARQLEDELGERMSDSETIEAMCAAVFESATVTAVGDGDAGGDNDVDDRDHAAGAATH